MRYPGFKTLCLMIGIVGLAACGTSKPTKYYLLSSGISESVADSAARELTIGVGPVVLPPYLNRRELVSRTSSNELNVAIYNKWAEPLQDNVSRVVGEDLGRRLGTDRIVQLPMKRSLRKALMIDYQVTISVSKYEKTSDGNVVLNARWGILDDERKELVLRRSGYSQVPAADDYAAQAAAQSDVLGRLIEEIAATITELEQSAGR
jgi:uncharacterized lipoprotein YmbA